MQDVLSVPLWHQFSVNGTSFPSSLKGIYCSFRSFPLPPHLWAIVIVYHVTIVAIGHGLMTKFWPLVIVCVLRTAVGFPLFEFITQKEATVRHFTPFWMQCSSFSLPPFFLFPPAPYFFLFFPQQTPPLSIIFGILY